jgi:hypothetical protein
MKKLFFCLVCFFIQGFSFNVKESLNKIEKNDKKKLDLFFRTLIGRDEFGFTLFGQKPVSTVYWESPQIWEEICSDDHYSMILSDGLAVWNQYRHLFPLKKYILIETRLNDHVDELVLVNYEEALHVIKEQITLFQDYFQEKGSPQTIFDRCLAINFKPKHSALFGILLGYGKQNAFRFHKREELQKKVFLGAKIPNAVVPEYDEYKELSKEWNSLESFEKGDPLNIVKFPRFVVDLKDSETKEILEKIKKAKKKISLVLKSEDFLEVVLSRLCE